MKIKIVGAGLIGTSMALGLKVKGHAIALSDSSDFNLGIANDLVEPTELNDPELIIIAVPIEQTWEALQDEFRSYPQAIFIDIGGLKSELLQQVEELPELAKRFCGTHPMAGREISGPTGARADLFEGATWIVTPAKESSESTLKLVESIISELGGVSIQVSAEEHDRAIAAISHLPQIVSSALGGELADLGSAALSLAGQGLRDMTRLAESNAELWSGLLLNNVKNVDFFLNNIESTIKELRNSLAAGNREELRKFFIAGNEGKSLIPGKHGRKSRDYVYLPIVIEDKPGQLAAIFNECAKANVNVEDLFIEHSPGQETGLITLALSPDDSEKLFSHLTELNGWRVHRARTTR